MGVNDRVQIVGQNEPSSFRKALRAVVASCCPVIPKRGHLSPSLAVEKREKGKNTDNKAKFNRSVGLYL